MTKGFSKFLAAFMTVCILTMTVPAAYMEAPEGEETAEWIEAVEPETEFMLSGDPETPVPSATPSPADAQRGPLYYAEIAGAEAIVFADSALTEIDVNLSGGDAVLVTDLNRDVAAIAYASGDETEAGYVSTDAIRLMTASEAEALQNALAEGGNVKLYRGDVQWPLPVLYPGVVAKASDFTALSNDREFVVQGKTITARMVGDHSDCWSWARALYDIIWGVKFTSDWYGTEETGLNLIADLTDDERQLTGANLKKYVGMAELGATLRICSCPRDCSNIDKDGCSKHEKHSLMIVSKDSAGMVVMDNMTGNGSDKFATRYYTWDNFAKHWAKYKMIKYIKWPGAQVYGRATPTPEVTPTPTPEPVDPTGVTIDKADEVSLGLGDTLQLNAVLSPFGAVSDLEWKSSSEKIATVSQTGLVTPVKAGTATVGVMTENGLTASVKVKVVAAGKVKLNKSGTITLGVGEQVTVKAAVSPAGASQSVNWASSNTGAALVEDGVITGMSAGSATITAKTLVGGKSAKVKVKVVDADAVTKVTLSKSGTVSMAVGATLDVDVALTPSNAKTTLKWASSKTSVATAEDGVITAVGAGTATVGVVTANGKKASFKVKVTDSSAVSKVALNKSGTVELKAGETLTLAAALTPAGAKTALTWASSDEDVATVEDGVVTAVAAGTATVGVVTSNGKKASVKVKVTGAASAATTTAAVAETADDDAADDGEVTEVKLNKSGTLSLKKGESVQLAAAFKPANATTAYVWKSTDTDVAVVTDDGMVTATATGTATVGVLCENGKYATVKIKVK